MSSVHVKHAEGGHGVGRLYRETTMLRRAAQPGVVEIVGHHFGANRGELHLAAVDGDTFDTTTFSDLASLTRTIAALAATVAHLHEAGIYHGRITADHVIVSRLDGRPVLCGFGEAVEGEPNDTARGATDVEAIGRLLQSRLPDVACLLRDYDQPGRRQADESHLLPVLSNIATEATASDSAARPTARRLAAGLRLAALTPPPPSRTGRPRHRRGITMPNKTKIARATAVVVASIVLIAVGGRLLPSLSRSSAVDTASLISCQKRAPKPLVADIDGDGCADTISIDGTHVTVNGESYQVGQAGDQLLLGRWACDAPRTLVLVRPSNGNVYVYDRWPAPGAQETPRLVATVRGVQHVTAKLDSDGCDSILATTRSGDEVLDPRAKARA